MYLQDGTGFEGVVDIEQREVVAIHVGKSHLGLVSGLLRIVGPAGHVSCMCDNNNDDIKGERGGNEPHKETCGTEK